MIRRKKVKRCISICRKDGTGYPLILALFIIMTLFSFGILEDLNAQSTEYELKAVAFQKLSLFIEWPANTFEDDESEFVIGVIGNNPFGNLLETVYENVKIKERNVKILYFRDLKQILRCHLLFIPKVSFYELGRVLEVVGTNPVLTIADSDGFAEAGCLINFYNYKGKLRFEINQKALQSSGFSIDFKLLNVSKIVNPAGK